MVSESQLQQQVADYLRLRHPKVLFHSDFGSSVRMSVRQGALKKRQNGGRRGWPDMFVAEPREIYNDIEGYTLTKFEDGHAMVCGSNMDGEAQICCGLFLELKKDGTRLKKKNGEWATEHIAEQAEVLENLRQRGYCAEFAVGFDEAKKIIDEYLGKH